MKICGSKVKRQYRDQPLLPIYTERVFCPVHVLNITSAEVLPPRTVFYRDRG